MESIQFQLPEHFNDKQGIAIISDITSQGFILEVEGGNNFKIMHNGIDLFKLGRFVEEAIAKQEVVQPGVVVTPDVTFYKETTRVEVTDANGRSYTNLECNDVQTQLQDDGKTLKIFIT